MRNWYNVIPPHPHVLTALDHDPSDKQGTSRAAHGPYRTTRGR